jgi:hypothetical protein
MLTAKVTVDPTGGSNVTHKCSFWLDPRTLDEMNVERRCRNKNK